MAGGRRPAGLALGWGCCLLLCCAAASKLEISMPPVVEVEVGGTARIECNFYIPENASYTYIDWFYVDHSTKQVRLYHVTASGVLKDDTDYKKRLSLGEDKALSISAVTLQDPKTFMCQVGAGSYGVGENSTELIVYKVPTTPEIEPYSGGISVHSNKIPEIAKCVSKNGFPSPNITWHKNGEQLYAQENQVTILSTLTRESSGLFTVSSTLYALVTRQDRQSQFHCTVHYWQGAQQRARDSQPVKVNIFYPSENLKLKVMPSSMLVKEGDNVTLVCEADGNPQPVFSFFKKNLDEWQDVTSLADDSGVLRLHDVNKTNNGTYRCQSLDLDDMSQIEEDVDLVVNYIEGVHVKMEPSSTLREGDSVTLSCDAHSPVGLKYQWRDDKGKKLVEGNQLFLSNLTFEKSNTFSCKVMAPSVPGLEQSKKVSVAVEGKPRIVAISSPLYVRHDEVINLTCKAIAFPPPTVQWSINGTAHEYVDNQHIASNLTVRVSHDLLRAGAMCRVSNRLGASEKHIQLVVDQKSTAESQGVIIVAIIVAILVVAVLGAVIYFLHKKGKIPCGRAGKQDITKPEARKDKIVVEVKSDKLSEEAGLLQGANGEKRAAADQSEKYIDLRN
ncbi:cell surface glycoprotein MUC18 isoform X1 [Haemorhous mexicanus]|uniref:cell surface glycoprotein MUC18 isoform X1 n=1 Tax=Haemorhous mexicanus TaxID=30427 RepID=UPI0028BDC3A5|nr:cell surface glycoprotein MUC18 isoform X1 [Haemorhous mexicanus]